MALDKDEQHLEERGRLKPFLCRPAAQLCHDGVHEGAKMVAHADTRAERRPAGKGVRQLYVERLVAPHLLGVPVLDPLSVLVLVRLEVRLAERDEHAEALAAELRGVIDEEVAKVWVEAHLLLVQVLARHVAHPPLERAQEAAPHCDRRVAGEVGEVIASHLAFAIKLGDGHVVLHPPSDERLDGLASPSEQDVLECLENGDANGRVAMVQVRQHRFDEPRRVRLHRLAAHRLHHRRQHLAAHQHHQGARAAQSRRVVVAADAEDDRAYLGDVRAQQSAHFEQSLRRQRDERRPQLFGRLRSRLGAEPLDEHRQEKGQGAGNVGYVGALDPLLKDARGELAASLGRVGEAEQQRAEQRLALVAAQWQAAELLKRGLP
mmetsp:Transcript_27034/g.80731  ORF Transcript_27034/g.80731 Transcript_27034/m.80731 type:complete len:377 (+) Transcript_27034:1116-2246(+)